MARHLSVYSFLIGVVIYRQTSQSWTSKERSRYARRQYLNHIAASQSSHWDDLTERSNLHCFVRAVAIHADRIILAPKFLWYKMTVIARIYGVLRTSPVNCEKYAFLLKKRPFLYITCVDHKTFSGIKWWLPSSSWVHLTCGSLRGLGAFFWLRVFSAPKHCPRPPTRR